MLIMFHQCKYNIRSLLSSDYTLLYGSVKNKLIWNTDFEVVKQHLLFYTASSLVPLEVDLCVYSIQ